MKRGYLSQYFSGVAIKRLSAVEVDSIRSNQHEFNGVRNLQQILGEPTDKDKFQAKFLYLNDDDDDPVYDDGTLTWYDARRKAREERGVERREYRLYFSENRPLQCAAEGDLLVIARRRNDLLLAIVAEKDSTIERQLAWLFGFSELSHPGFSIRSELETEQDRIGFAARVVLEQIGVESYEEATNLLDDMLSRFPNGFPSTAVFSDYARSTLPEVSSLEDPDAALVAWSEREEILFRTLEKHLLGNKVRSLVEKPVGNIEPESLIEVIQSSLQQRRSRAGSSLENHLQRVFEEHGLQYTRGGTTEGKLKPDFIFPGIKQYHDSSFAGDKLTMLASKATCKDRWRQIINEAARISQKHLFTLEPGISENQTNEMKVHGVQLVVPRSIYPTYTVRQQEQLFDLSMFIELLRAREAK